MPRFLLTAAIVLGLGFALGSLAAPLPLSAQTASEAAETAFWDSVKDSREPDEVRAYLEKFPNGLFAPLARIRLRNLEASKTPAPAPSAAASTPPQQQSSSAPALTSESIIREVQDRLYNLNYQIADERQTAG
jgi:hypothetical protein